MRTTIIYEWECDNGGNAFGSEYAATITEARARVRDLLEDPEEYRRSISIDRFRVELTQKSAVQMLAHEGFAIGAETVEIWERVDCGACEACENEERCTRGKIRRARDQ